MPLEISTGFGVSSLVWISSLDPQQMGPSNRIIEDLTSYFATINLSFAHYQVSSAQALYALLDGIAARARLGARPLLHLDMHGSKEGLAIAGSGELAPWPQVMSRLQKINIATKGNLFVVAGVCYALHAIKSIQITEPCPVHILIAPEDLVFNGFLEDGVVNFYRGVFETGAVNAPHEDYLSAQMKVFYSEKLLAVALTKYIREDCKGKGGARRKERLLTETLSTRTNNRQNRRKLQKQIDEFLKPTPALLERYARTFLAGRPCPFTLNELLSLVASTNEFVSKGNSV